MKILLYYYSTISWMQMSYSTKYWHYTVGCQCFCTGYNCCYLLYFLCVYLPAAFSHLSVFYYVIFIRMEFYLCEQWVYIQQDSTLATPPTLRGTWLAWQKWRSKVSCCLTVCLSVFLPANSFSFCDVCVPNWLEATIIYISVSCPCIMQQSSKRSSNWTWLVFSHAVTK